MCVRTVLWCASVFYFMHYMYARQCVRYGVGAHHVCTLLTFFPFLPTTQAVNAYYGCYLYALATQNVDLQQFANTLLTMEIGATQTYWHMGNADIYDTLFANARMVGNVGALDVTASTWFGDNAEYVHGINM